MIFYAEPFRFMRPDWVSRWGWSGVSTRETGLKGPRGAGGASARASSVTSGPRCVRPVLGWREKTVHDGGVLYHLERDYHEANFPFLLEHGVPIHGILSEGMKKDWRFMCLYPEVWSEVEEVLRRDSKERVTLSVLPSYSNWANDWSRSNWHFQNKGAGRLGEKIHHFEPGSDVGIIDFHLYCIRWITRPGIARAYWERFSAAKHASRAPVGGRTLHRRLTDSVDLIDFGITKEDEEIQELTAFFQKTSAIREQAKNLYAPRPDRSFNSFDGCRDPLPMEHDITWGSGSTRARQRAEEEDGRREKEKEPRLRLALPCDNVLSASQAAPSENGDGQFFAYPKEVILSLLEIQEGIDFSTPSGPPISKRPVLSRRDVPFFR
ncbi:hypothetical protein K438DRAFT_1771686 [Mycena galopus ATCC 62051]|nr:hypothetical protein K438DRAFT_1771686 [Mycena galopus ATCC 62051]